MTLLTVAAMAIATATATSTSTSTAGGGYGYVPAGQGGSDAVDVVERLNEPIPGRHLDLLQRFEDDDHVDGMSFQNRH